MDSIEEPQKKVFKARKTMRVSDRQQLEAVYKVKEELLKTDVKLLNGNHENGDLDPTSPLENIDYIKDKEEVNGIEEICFDPEENKTEWKEMSCILNVNVKNKQDDNLSCEPLSPKNITPESASKLTTEPASGDPATVDPDSEELASIDPASGDPSADPSSADPSSADPSSREPVSGDLSSGDSTSGEPVSTQVISGEPVSGEPVSGETASGEIGSGDPASDNSASGDLAPGELSSGDPACSELAYDDLVSGDLASGKLASGELASELTSESTFEATFEPSSVPVCEPITEADNTGQSSKKDDDFLEKKDDDEKLDQIQCKDSFDQEKKGDSNIGGSEEAAETDNTIICSDLLHENEKKVEEDPITELALGEEAISSSMEIDHGEKNEDENSTDLVESIHENVKKDDKNENILESADSMETDEIIPILEKLAPAEDELTCFSKTSLLSNDETNPDLEEKMEGSFGSPSKQESSESLPKEAFLVLSDEEDIPCEKEESEVISQNETRSPAEIESNEKDSKPEEEEQVIDEEDERPSEKNECSRRKRSKSEDMDNVQSKRRRYIEEEYEAEFQVKITAKGDINQKLQKVIQWLLEEKLCALQCAVFDKTLAELKTRVEKIECNKRHKTVLTELQAKIARLTKRFGAAKEDLKKRQENPPNPPVSPGKSASDVNSNNNIPYRNAGTVRQMLESKRNVSESTPSTFQTPVNTVSSTNLVTPPAVVSSQPKLQTPVTSGSLTAASVLPAPNTATVVATTQVPNGNPQPTISIQPLPVILHVPVAVSSQPQLLQSHPGTLVTNQPSGNVEFISVQSPPTVSGLTKNPVSLPSLPNPTKPNNGPSVPSPSIQRNSPASAAPLGTTLAVQAVPTAHSIVQATRTSLPTVGPSGLYSPSNNRGPIQMKIPISAFSTSSSAEQNSTTTPRIENQTNKTVDASVNKKAADSTSQSGKATGNDSSGVIDLTMDDEETGALQDPKKLNHTPVSAMGSSQPMSRPLQPIQPAPPLQASGVPTSGPSQTTIHLLPAAPTTVNVTHRPITQVTTRLPVPRAPGNHQVVYTTLPAPPPQAPLRGTVMQAPAVRQVNPQNSVTVRVPQTTTYVVNNGLTLGSAGPQLTVHHRPPQVHTEPPRPVHPAPLPEAPQPQRLPPEAASTSLPQKPHLKLARVQSQNGIVLSWSVLEVDRSCATVESYHLYAYHEEPSATVPSQWKKIGEVKALPLPMACTLTQFVSGSKYYFAVRAKDIYGRFGPFCDPQSTDVISSSQSN
ncbi:activating transcription factor 7-interacting protein 1 isoform X1 [Marmota monax]|uniref:activating transcription factor 7-interacting protein 1 isoform X1 n=1 Tax=Marmota monax TaxID=9995 RepID=UPI001EAFA4B2|nr:activating transcription factor 7-interacting protein 1 isoform X1 [Marmota monax]XP_046291413.1 activating transcription factor 7-interacting protein 1 isoform X1 [Marmota monax]XP_058432324.1 activating transcription factor 7-interacting protein 1 isoform X1 [Marmota monax]XP_058432325.1 activating transcription factor 7-interacting protein 1 isoform X1 [Marmota monax]XP_058432326.1 activating transcription factor 7-interacting protein 1 isoform X1 [Marmota monax]